MSYFGPVVICLGAFAALYLLWVAASVSSIGWITWLHDGKKVSDAYPEEWVKYHREMGGW
jgi:hypothetical protein